MALSAGAVYATLGGKFDRAGFDQFGSSMYRARGEMDAFEKKSAASSARVSESMHKMGQVAKVAAVGGVVALGAAIAGSVKTAADFDRSMRNVNSIAKLSEKQFQSLSRGVLELSGKTAQAPKTLADGMYQLVSSGFNARDSLKILRSSAIAASAGLTTTETATTAVAAALNAYHLPASKAQQVSDTLFQTVNRGVITFEELSHTIGLALPFANSLHIGLGQVGASISTLTKEGIPAAEASTYLKNAMVAFLKPSKDLQAAIKATGAESGEALVKQKGFQGALEAVAKQTDGTKAGLQKLFPDIRASAAAFALTGSNAKTAEGDVKAFGNTAGVTQKVFAEQSKSAAFQFQKFKAELQAAGVVVGSIVLPVLTKGVQAIAQWVEHLNSTGQLAHFGHEVADGFKEVGKIFSDLVPLGSSIVHILSSIASALNLSDATNLEALLAAVIGFKVVSTIGPLVVGLARGLTLLAASGDIAAAAMIALDIAMDANPIGAVALAVGALAAAFILLRGHLGGIAHSIGSTFSGMAHALEGPFRSAASTILGLFSTILSAGASVVRTMSGIPLIGGAFKGMANGIQSAADAIDGLRNRINGVKPPPDLNVQIKDAAALAALRRLQGTKLGDKVVQVLAKDESARSKIRALIALGIPPKTARVLADVGNALSGVSSVRAAIASLQNRTVYIDTVQRLHRAATTGPGAGFGPSPGNPGLGGGHAAGRSAGAAQTSLVGEGAAPEWVVNPQAGTAQYVTGPTVMQLAPEDYVIPTEPRYRGRALGFLADIAASLGAAYAGGKKGHHEKRLSPHQYLRLSPDQYQARDQSAQSHLDKLRQNKKTPARELAKARRDRDLAHREYLAAKRFADHVAAYEQEADIGATLMQTADGRDDKLGFAAGRKKRLYNLREALHLLQVEHGRAKPGSKWERDIRQNIAQLTGDLQSAAEAVPGSRTEIKIKEQKRLDQINQDIALAALTDSTTDDVTAAKELVDFLGPIVMDAVAHPAKRGGAAGVADLAGQLKTARDNLSNLTAGGAGGSTDGGLGQDAQAQIDQANLRASNAEAGLASSSALLQVLGSSGDIGAGGPNARTAVIQNNYMLHPSDPKVLLAVANATVAGIDYQGTTPSPRESLGV